VQKAGGTTVEAILRRNFGMRHMLVNPRSGWSYDSTDLRADLRLNPWTRSIGSHWLRPYMHFGELDERMVWYIYLRHPIDRFLSHYQYHVESMGVKAPFSKWMNNKIQQNWQTRFIAGEPDVEAAKQILASRFRAVGLVERFDESLLLIRRALGFGENFSVWYGRPHNPTRARSQRSDIREEYREECIERNQLDLELYDYAVNTLFAQQLLAYGEELLRRDCTLEFGPRDPKLSDRLRDMSYLLYRRTVHQPATTIRQSIAGWRGLPSVRR
jgi:hypothetical protein